jgi:hypothetical protein
MERELRAVGWTPSANDSGEAAYKRTATPQDGGERVAVDPNAQLRLQVDMSRIRNERRQEDNRHSEVVNRLQQEYSIHQDTHRLQQAIQQENARHNQATEKISRDQQALDLKLQQMREQQEVRMSALKNPWLQRLTGMAPKPGQPGSAEWSPTQPYGQQNAQRPTGLADSIQQLLAKNPSLDDPEYQKVLMATRGWVWWPNEQLDPATGRPTSGSYPGVIDSGQQQQQRTTPSFNDFSHKDPFSMAAWRTQQEWNDPGGFASASDQMRSQWAGQGIKEQPATTQLSWDTSSPEQHASTSMLSDVFGTTPQQYSQKQQRQWAASAAPQVGMRT